MIPASSSRRTASCARSTAAAKCGSSDGSGRLTRWSEAVFIPQLYSLALLWWSLHNVGTAVLMVRMLQQIDDRAEQIAEQDVMKEKRTGEFSATPTGTDWDRLRSLTDTQIRTALESDPEVIPTDAGFWKGAKVVLAPAQANGNDSPRRGSPRVTPETEGIPNQD